MTGKDTTMVSSGDGQKNVVPPWLRAIAGIKLYDLCEIHSSKECNFYCRVCMVAMCKECMTQHDLSGHEVIKAYKFDRVASFRVKDLEPSWDIYDICSYNKNGWFVAVIHKRGDGIGRSHDQSDAGDCESCQYRLKSPSTKYCSVECKVEALMKMTESESMKKEAKRKVETISGGSSSNVQSFRKQPRKQKNPQRAPFY
ncbi:ATP-dependent Clp protease proteolytic subunit [Psidium guajava]|nr:ATP-dependent Clp protease proteolytic subunit [Psidium guajava]